MHVNLPLGLYSAVEWNLHKPLARVIVFTAESLFGVKLNKYSCKLDFAVLRGLVSNLNKK